MTARPSRRAALAGSAAALFGLGAPVALAAAVEGKSPATAPSLSSEAAALQAELARLSREYGSACRQADDTLDATAEIPPPDELFTRLGDSHLFARVPEDSWWDSTRCWWGEPDLIDKLRASSFRYLSGGQDQRAVARRDEVVTAWDRWKAERRAAEDASGHTAAEERFEAAFRTYHEFRQRLAETRTADPGVIVAKALAVVDLCRSGDGLDRVITRAVKRDAGAYEEAMALSLARDFIGLLGADQRVMA